MVRIAAVPKLTSTRFDMVYLKSVWDRTISPLVGHSVCVETDTVCTDFAVSSAGLTTLPNEAAANPDRP